MREKQCNKCLKTKQISEFYKDSSQPDKHSYMCKLCELKIKKSQNKKRKDSYTPESQEKLRSKCEGKICTKCNKFKSWDSFGDRQNLKDGKNSQCKSCDRVRANNSLRKNIDFKNSLNPEIMDPNAYLAIIKRSVNPLIKSISTTRKRAKSKSIRHSIKYEDLLPIPSKCPLLDIPLYYTLNKVTDNTPSIDRIDNDYGYTKDNVWIISNKANRIKSNVSINELELLLQNLKLKI